MKQSGITLVEMLVALAILAAATVGVTRLVALSVDDSEISVAAAQVKAVGDAASAYIQDNFTSISAIATTTQPVLIRVSDLVDSGYLTAGFSGQNSRRQTACVLVLQPSPAKLDALLVTEGGDGFDDLALGQLAATVGGAGGGIYSTDPTVVRGAIGGYEFPVGAYANANHLGQRCDGSGGAVAFTAGHAAMALWFANGTGNDSTLYRSAIPGQPDLNTMNTPILMGVGAVQTVGTACTATGAIGRNNDGAVVSCSAGTWKLQGSAFWQDAVASFAALPACNAASLGHTRVALTPSVGSGPRAYTCNGGGTWVAVGVDNLGNLSLPGTVVTGKVQVNDVASIGAGCSPNGLIARDSVGVLLSCQSGVWRNATGGGTGMTGVMKPLAGRSASCTFGNGYTATAVVNSDGTYYLQVGRFGGPICYNAPRCRANFSGGGGTDEYMDAELVFGGISANGYISFGGGVHSCVGSFPSY